MAVKTNDESGQGKLRNRDKVIAAQRTADLRSIMSLPEGRRFMYEMIFHRCGLLDVYVAQDSGIYRHEGGRGVGQRLATEIQMQLPDLYIQMVSEQLKDEKNEQILRDAAETKSNKEIE